MADQQKPPTSTSEYMVRERANWRNFMTREQAIAKARQANPAYAEVGDDTVFADVLRSQDDKGQPLYEAYRNPHYNSMGQWLLSTVGSAAGSAGKFAVDSGKSLLSVAGNVLPWTTPVGLLVSDKTRGDAAKALGQMNPLSMAEGAVNYIQGRFAGFPDVMANAELSQHPASPSATAVQDEAIRAIPQTPFVQNVGKDPVGMFADMSLPLSAGAGLVNLARGGSRLAMGTAARIPLVSDVVNTAKATSTGQKIARAAASAGKAADALNTAADAVDPLVLGARGVHAAATSGLANKARQALATNITGHILGQGARAIDPVQEMGKTVLQEKIPLGPSTLRGGQVSDPSFVNVEREIADITDARDTAIMQAAQNDSTAYINPQSVVNQYEPKWGRHIGDMVTGSDRLGKAWSLLDKFLFDNSTGLRLDPRRRPGANAAKEANEALDKAQAVLDRERNRALNARDKNAATARVSDANEAVLRAQAAKTEAENLGIENPQKPTWGEAVAFQGEAQYLPMSDAVNVRHSMNKKLNEPFNVLRGGIEDQVVPAEVEMALLEGYNAEVFRNVENHSRQLFAEQRAKVGLPVDGPEFEAAFQREGMTEAKLHEMGKHQALLMDIRDAVKRIVEKSGRQTPPINEQPYMVSQTGMTLRDVALGRMPGPTQLMASALFPLRFLYKHFPEKASEFAIRMYDLHPDPEFWAKVYRISAAPTEARAIEKARTSAPPPEVPQSMRQQPAAQQGGKYDR